MIKDEIIELLLKTKISQETINALYTIIIISEQQNQELEHVVLSEDKQFYTPDTDNFIIERF